MYPVHHDLVMCFQQWSSKAEMKQVYRPLNVSAYHIYIYIVILLFWDVILQRLPLLQHVEEFN